MKSNNNDLKPPPTTSGTPSKSGGDMEKTKKFYCFLNQKKFIGAIPELSGCIFDLQQSSQAKTFHQTLDRFATFVGTKYNLGGDVSDSVRKLQVYVPVPPQDPREDASRTKLKIWEVEITKHIKFKHKLKHALKGMFSIVWGQCTNYTCTRLQQQPGFKVLNNKQDSIGLLSMIRDLTFKLNNKQHPYIAMVDNDLRVFRFVQAREVGASIFLLESGSYDDETRQIEEHSLHPLNDLSNGTSTNPTL